MTREEACIGVHWLDIACPLWYVPKDTNGYADATWLQFHIIRVHVFYKQNAPLPLLVDIFSPLINEMPPNLCYMYVWISVCIVGTVSGILLWEWRLEIEIMFPVLHIYLWLISCPFSFPLNWFYYQVILYFVIFFYSLYN